MRSRLAQGATRSKSLYRRSSSGKSANDRDFSSSFLNISAVGQPCSGRARTSQRRGRSGNGSNRSPYPSALARPPKRKNGTSAPICSATSSRVSRGRSCPKCRRMPAPSLLPPPRPLSDGMRFSTRIRCGGTSRCSRRRRSASVTVFFAGTPGTLNVTSSASAGSMARVSQRSIAWKMVRKGCHPRSSGVPTARKVLIFAGHSTVTAHIVAGQLSRRRRRIAKTPKPSAASEVGSGTTSTTPKWSPYPAWASA